jgi:deazaflavin-dependent oxidoreductase (nitroreductase family)
MMQRLAWSAPGIFVFSRTLHYLDIPLQRLTGARVAVPAVLAGLPVISLTTTGARSGRPRALPLVALADGDRFVVIASNWGRRRHPSWYYNLLADPETIVTVGGRSGTYLAREAAGTERDAYWQQAVRLYAGYRTYERRAGGRRIPIIVLEPK